MQVSHRKFYQKSRKYSGCQILTVPVCFAFDILFCLILILRLYRLPGDQGDRKFDLILTLFLHTVDPLHQDLYGKGSFLLHILADRSKPWHGKFRIADIIVSRDSDFLRDLYSTDAEKADCLQCIKV